MARRKAVGARRSQAAEVVSFDVTPDDPIPSFVLDFFQHQYAKDNDHEDSRPAKRRKTEYVEVDSVPILQEELAIRRPSDEVSTAIQFLPLRCLQTHLRFELTDTDGESKAGYPYIFTVSTRPSLKKENFSMGFPLKEDAISDRLATILRTRDTFWSNPSVEDATWISADADLDANDTTTTLRLKFQVRWNVSTTTSTSVWSHYQRKFRNQMLAMAFPTMFGAIAEKQGNSCSPQVFYQAAHVPTTEDTPADNVEIPLLNTKLYPFQRRAVKWMLQREGVEWIQDRDGKSSLNHVGFDHFDAPSAFVRAVDVEGRDFHVSPLLGKATKDLEFFKELEQNFKGGILSEEMGLGKTVELMALFSLHPQHSVPADLFDNYLGEKIRSVRTTLIVAPQSLKKQWLSELNKHAPCLHIMLYNGLTQSAREDEVEANALIEKLASHDVVVTTYNVLSSELDYALGEPDRARRAPRKYHRPRSPLTQLCWWRVCLDEAQMIESGVSKAATLARLIPRVNAWGVTGTPVKDNVEDLRGLLLFLRYEPFASNNQAWTTLIKSHEDGFRRLFKHMSLRHSKRLVRREIDIPAQKRYVISMPFTAVEEQHYQSLFKEVIEACGLSSNGAPLRDDWDPEDPGVLDAMRTALDRLRQTALHPEVGTRNRRALGRRNGPMRTVAEVLDVMIEQSEVSIRIDQRALLNAKLTRGQLYENSPRVKMSLEIWEGVSKTISEMVEECRKHLRKEIEQAKAGQGDADRADNQYGSDEEVDDNEKGRVGEARRRLRSALEIQHKAAFFCANAYYQIKLNQEMTEPESAEFHRLEKLETQGYEAAKTIRREILEESRGKALKLMKKIATSASKQSFAVVPEYKTFDLHGIESGKIVESLGRIAGELNDQANLLDDWREHVIQLLLKSLVDEEDEVELTGEEYEDSTKIMEEIVVYIQIIRTAIADRECVMSGQVNELIEHEAKAAQRQAREGEGPFPEKVLELFQLRDRVKSRSQHSLRAVVSELRALTVKLRPEATKGSNRARMELDIVTRQLKDTQKHLSEQQKAAIAMNQELDIFTATMNARVDYYRQLQNLSDSVAPYEGQQGEAQERLILSTEESLARRLDGSQAKHRYLLHLKELDAADGDQRICIICRENFTIGVLTVCGHQFCKVCIGLWFRANHNCPVCKRRLHASSLHDITLKPQDLKVHADSSGTSPKKGANIRTGTQSAFKQSAIYSEFNSEKLAEIKSIDLEGPAFTTKVDNLVRHLIWLRENDPGAKSIIFSQYSDFLQVLGLAFKRRRIGYTSFDRHNGITDFKEDPAVECFLLHARAHASGLNLVNASHVFLCEPLINTALELQAIARVHRIGQEQETTVWLYIVDGTVEESIYNLSVRRRMNHIGDHDHDLGDSKGKSKDYSTPKVPDEAIEAANSIELEQANLSKLMAKGKRRGEAVEKGDLWECLFGHVDRTTGGQNGNDDDAGGGGGEPRNPGPAIRDFLAAEAAQRRRDGGEEVGVAG